MILGCGPAADPGAWIAEVGGHRIPLERLAEASEGMEGQTEEAREKALLIELDEPLPLPVGLRVDVAVRVSD